MCCSLDPQACPTPRCSLQPADKNHQKRGKKHGHGYRMFSGLSVSGGGGGCARTHT